MRVSGLCVAVALAALSACDPYDRDEFDLAALAWQPACTGDRAAFWIPPRLCPEALAAWDAASAEFGFPARPIGVIARAEPWEREGRTVGGTFDCDASRMVIAADRHLCLSSMAHETVHAVRCAEPRELEREHLPLDEWGDRLRPAPGTLNHRVVEVQRRCLQ